MKPIILFRRDGTNDAELEIARKYFDAVERRGELAHKHRFNNSGLVIGRYSVLPFYKELEDDLRDFDCKLINSHAEHEYIANFDYYHDIKNYTPKTYFSLREVIQSGYQGPFVVKGRTNSRKYQWRTHMFAANIDELYRIDNELRMDGFLGFQELIYREYVPLEYWGEGLNGLKHTNEWRAFFYKNNLLSIGYYWSSASDDVINRAKSYSLKELLCSETFFVTHKVLSQKTNFYVVDFARTIEGNWIVIEANEQMSGLSENNPDLLYGNLAKCLEG